MTEPSGVSVAQAPCWLLPGLPAPPLRASGLQTPGPIGGGHPLFPTPHSLDDLRPFPGSWGRTQAWSSLTTWLLWAPTGDVGTGPQICPWKPAGFTQLCLTPHCDSLGSGGALCQGPGLTQGAQLLGFWKTPFSGPRSGSFTPGGWCWSSVFLPYPHIFLDNYETALEPAGWGPF